MKCVHLPPMLFPHASRVRPKIELLIFRTMPKFYNHVTVLGCEEQEERKKKGEYYTQRLPFTYQVITALKRVFSFYEVVDVTVATK